MDHSKNAWWTALLQGLFLLLVGLFFVFRPETAIKSVSIYIGLILLLIGLASALRISKINKELTGKGPSYIVPIVLLVAGVVLIFFSTYAFTVLALAIGIWLLMDGISQVKGSGEISKLDKNIGNGLLILGIITILLSITIFMNPEGLFKVLAILFGLNLSISGAVLVILGIKLKK